MFKKFFLIECNRTLVELVKKRAFELGLTIPEYFRYIAAKDMEDSETRKATGLYKEMTPAHIPQS